MLRVGPRCSAIRRLAQPNTVKRISQLLAHGKFHANAFHVRAFHRRRHGDLYTDLTLEMGFLPSEMKLISLLQQETPDPKSVEKIGAIVSDIVATRGYDPLLKILQEVPETQRRSHSPVIYTTTLIAAIKKTGSVVDLHKHLSKMLGQPSKESMLRVLGNAVMSLPEHSLSALEAYIATVPSHYLADVCNVQVPLWLEAGASKKNLSFVLHATSGRLLFPSTPQGVATATSVLSNFAAYLQTVTNKLASLTARRRVPHLSEAFCVMVARAFTLSQIDEQALTLYIKAVTKTRPATGTSMVLGERFWRTLSKSGYQAPKNNATILRVAQRAALPTLAGACRVEIAELASKIERGEDVRGNSALFVARYARMLRMVSGERAPLALASAQRHGNKVLGSHHEANRNRRWLTAALENCVRRKRYVAASELVPGVKQTRTPFLWSLAVTTLACTNRTEEGWQWVKEMHDLKLPINKNAAVALLKATLQTERASFAQNLQTLEKSGVTLDDADLAAVFHHAGTGSCSYTWKDLKSLAQDAAKVSQTRLRAIRDDFEITSSTTGKSAGNIIGKECIREIVWWAFLKTPDVPWRSVHFVSSLQAYGVAVEVGELRASLAHAFQKLGRPSGEAKRVMLQAGHSLGYISDQFSSEWDKLHSE